MTIDILIGQDMFWELMSGEVLRGDKGIIAQRSVFGWVLSGSCGNPSTGGVAMLNISNIPENIISKFWDLRVHWGGREVRFRFVRGQVQRRYCLFFTNICTYI